MTRLETITLGTNELVGSSPENIVPQLKTLFAGTWKTGQSIPLWDGKTASRIVAALLRM